jgi:hypothetical protein
MISQVNESRVISYHKIRLLVGIIGMLLPFVLWFGNAFLNHSSLLQNRCWIIFKNGYTAGADLKYSISHFYYSTVGELFTGALCAVSLFLFCYRGYPKPQYGKYHFVPGDNFMANLAATMALLIVVFPTTTEETITDNFRSFVSGTCASMIHYIAAAIFFTILALFTFVNFRRTKSPEDFGTMKSHPIYKWCGIVMMVCLVILFTIYILSKANVDVEWADAINLTYWLETVMLLAFGISWTVKSEVDQQVLNKNVFGNGVK